jgi:hypothetical protein
MSKRHALRCAIFLFLIASPLQAQNAASDSARLQGTWTMLSGSANGMTMPPEYASLGQLEHSGDRYVSREVIAIVHTALGEVPRALAELQRAVADRSINLVFALRDPAFDPLRHEPAFDRLLEETGLRTRAGLC